MPSLAILISAVLVLSCGQTESQTESHTEADDRYTNATTVDVSNYADRVSVFRNGLTYTGYLLIWFCIVTMSSTK